MSPFARISLQLIWSIIYIHTYITFSFPLQDKCKFNALICQKKIIDQYVYCIIIPANYSYNNLLPWKVGKCVCVCNITHKFFDFSAVRIKGNRKYIQNQILVLDNKNWAIYQRSQIHSGMLKGDACYDVKLF